MLLPISNDSFGDQSIFNHPLLNRTNQNGGGYAGNAINFQGNAGSFARILDRSISKEMGASLRINTSYTNKSKQHIISKGNDRGLYTRNDGNTYLQYINDEYNINCRIDNTRNHIIINIVTGGNLETYCNGNQSLSTGLSFSSLRPIQGDIIL